MCVSRSGVFYFAQIAGRLGGDSPLWRPVSTQTSAGRRCAPASCAAMITYASSACDTASTARRRPCITVSRPGAIQAMPGRPGILSAFARAATMRCTTATASSSRRWASSGGGAPGKGCPPPLKTDRIFRRRPVGRNSIQPRRVFGAGGSRGNKATGRARGNLGGGFFGVRRFCAKKRNFPGQTAAGSVSKVDTKGA